MSRRSWIMGIFWCKNTQKKLSIFNCFWKYSNLIEGRSHRNDSIARNCSITWLKPNDSTKSRRLPNASSCICSQGSDRHISSYSNSRTSATSSRNTIFSVRIVTWTIDWRFGRTSHRKFIHISLSNHQSSGFFQVLHTGCRIGCNIIFHHLWAAGCEFSLNQNIILDHNW